MQAKDHQTPKINIWAMTVVLLQICIYTEILNLTFSRDSNTSPNDSFFCHKGKLNSILIKSELRLLEDGAYMNQLASSQTLLIKNCAKKSQTITIKANL